VDSEGLSRSVTLLLNDAYEALDKGDWSTARARAATVLAIDRNQAQAQRIAELALQGRTGRIGPGDWRAGSTVLDAHRLGHAVSRVAALAPFSKVADRIIASFEVGPMSAGDLARVIATEPSLAATVLRVANSAYYEQPAGSTSVEHAIASLGAREVESLALTASITALLPNGTVVPRHDFWRFSICVATLAGAVAEASGERPAQAFAAGLLHEVGLLALDLYSPQELRVAVALQRYDARPLQDRERQVFGFTDADLGAALARRWSLPEQFVEAIESQGEHLDDDPEPPSALSAWIRCARSYVRCAAISDGVERSDGGAPPLEWSRAPLSEVLEDLGGVERILQRADRFLAATG
jgi:HD-like signal output (HDOD) protein